MISETRSWDALVSQAAATDLYPRTTEARTRAKASTGDLRIMLAFLTAPVIVGALGVLLAGVARWLS